MVIGVDGEEVRDACEEADDSGPELGLGSVGSGGKRSVEEIKDEDPGRVREGNEATHEEQDGRASLDEVVVGATGGLVSKSCLVEVLDDPSVERNHETDSEPDGPVLEHVPNEFGHVS